MHDPYDDPYADPNCDQEALEQRRAEREAWKATQPDSRSVEDVAALVERYRAECAHSHAPERADRLSAVLTLWRRHPPRL